MPRQEIDRGIFLIEEEFNEVLLCLISIRYSS